jgi:hypothetical protein
VGSILIIGVVAMRQRPWICSSKFIGMSKVFPHVLFISCADRSQDKNAKDVIEAYTEVDNVASEKVLMKAGFKRVEGTDKTLIKVIDENSGEKG